ncbi:conserved hypothetical protein [metagenome]
MKTNFKKPTIDSEKTEFAKYDNIDNSKNLTPEEFEDFIVKSGAKGSFMVYRSKKSDDELGIDEL